MSDDLDAFADALGAHLAEHERVPPLDFADVLARANAMVDEPLPESLESGIAELEDEPSADEDDLLDEGLAVFAADLRSHREEHLRARELAPIPELPRRGSRWIPFAVVAVAAAVLLTFALSIDWRATLLQRSDSGLAVEAERSRDDEDDREHARRQVSPQPAPEPELAPEVVPEPEIVPEPELAPEPEPAPRSPRPRAPSLDELEARARAAWQSGDLEEAERLYRRVIARAKGSTRAELAYGDLFSVAKRRGGSSAQAEVWRQYLRRFPEGRYADGARAGLCRRQPAARQPECWSEYLRRHPNGAHADKARELASKGDR